LISSIILWWLGTGSIRGFGVALTWGVAASLFTALVVTRMIFDFLLDRNWLKSIQMLHIIKATNLDFMKFAKPAFVISWTLIFIGIGYGFYRGKSMFGKDFLGGDTSLFSFERRVPEEKIRAALTAAGVNDALIQYEKDLSGGKQTLRIDTAAEEPGKAAEVSTADKVRSAVLSIPEGKFIPRGHEHVGAIVGETIRKSAIIASLVSLFGILVYVAFRYEFSFAVG